MARLVGVLQTSHGPFTNLPPERWDSIRLNRSYRSDVPWETEEEVLSKSERAKAAIEVLREKLNEMNPDVLVIFGDDQNECFDFSNFPALSVFVGESFKGPEPGTRGKPELYRSIPGHPGLAVHMLMSLLSNRFDPAFSQTDPNPEHGMCHAVMRPLEFLERYDIPVIPVLANGYYPPQPPAIRCYEVGRAVREAIDSYPEDLRVVAIGSGGLWHTPMRNEAYLDEEFDHSILNYLEKGDIRGMAEFFDSYKVPDGDTSQDISAGQRGMTGMPTLSGPQMGTRETCNWIGAAATADGRPTTVIDYIPIYASPIGTAFAYCDDV